MKPTLSQLLAFDALAGERHFGRAAAALGIAQPTLSKEIRRLEQNLGLTLFDRSARGTELTPEGERLQPRVAAVIEQVQRLDDAATLLRQDSQMRVRVAASPSIVNRLLPELLRVIDDSEEGPSIRVLEVDTGGVLRAVEEGRADVGIGHLLGQPETTRKRRLGGDELRVLMHRALAPGTGGPADLARLKHVPLLLWPREDSPDYYDLIVQTCRPHGLEPLVLSGTSRIGGSWSYFLQDARAFTIVPADFAQREARGSLVSLPLDPPAAISLEVVWGRHPAAPRVLDVLMDLTRPLRAGQDREAMTASKATLPGLHNRAHIR